MARIDVNVVDFEDASHLVQDGTPRRFNTVCGEDSIDIVGFDAMFVDHILFIAASEVPEPGYV